MEATGKVRGEVRTQEGGLHESTGVHAELCNHPKQRQKRVRESEIMSNRCLNRLFFAPIGYA